MSLDIQEVVESDITLHNTSVAVPMVWFVFNW